MQIFLFPVKSRNYCENSFCDTYFITEVFENGFTFKILSAFTTKVSRCKKLTKIDLRCNCMLISNISLTHPWGFGCH